MEAARAPVTNGEQAFGVGVMTRFGGITFEEAKKLSKDAIDDVLSRKGDFFLASHHSNPLTR